VQEDLNSKIARRLDEVAQLLGQQGANRFRVQAYGNAAETLRRLSRPVDEILAREGEEGLRKLPGIGERLARAIATLVFTGRLPMLQRLRGESDSELLLASVPGIGKVIAQRLHHDLGINTLEQLETAACDGRLEIFTGLGQKRIAGIIDSLASRLGRVQRRRKLSEPREPSIAELLEIDREYRAQAAEGGLPCLAPRRFNPTGEAWLPILHTERGATHYTALFSNTARAHQLQKTRDWVVLYWENREGEHQCTVITSQHGPLAGKRVIRGREAECADYYRRIALRKQRAASRLTRADPDDPRAVIRQS
jgi:Holliday junction resolvasome RuvABC DNA-binding subunit